MLALHRLPALLLLLMLGPPAATALATTTTTQPEYRSVPLASIQTLTLYSDALTTARRGQPIPQLTCRGAACRRYQRLVHVVQCRNAGDDGTGNIQWECSADLPQALRLGRVDVSCEGWSRPGDSNVLWGSCGLEYSLFKENGDGDGDDGRDRDRSFCSSISCQKFLAGMFNVLFFGVLALIVTSMIRACLADRRPAIADSPPPYSPGPGGPGGGGGPFGPGKPRPAPPAAQPPAQGWRPGFWTGLGLAGAAGWLWDLTRPRARDGRERGQQRRHVPVYGGIDDPYRDHRDRDWRDEPGPSRHHGHGRSDRGGGGSAGLGEVRTTVGFGGSTVR